MGIDYDRIKQLVSLVEQNQLAELSLEEDGLSVTIKAEAAVETVHVAAQPAGGGMTVDIGAFQSPTLVEEEPQPAGPAPLEGDLYEITSPMVGVFYRCSSPDSPPYVEVGDEVEEGQTVGLIEAMKVFSEVPSEVSGRVVAVPVGSGKLVQQDDVLVVIDTSASGAGE